jgi:chromate reductase
MVKILGLCGSLRKNSFNNSALKAALAFVPKGSSFETFDLGSLPLFNSDLEFAMPKSAKALKAKIEDADVIIFSTPEYNRAPSGVILNAINWACRPYGKNSFSGKVGGIISASTGLFGGNRAQQILRNVFVDLNILTLNSPEIFISKAAEKFDEKGNLTDEDTKKRLEAFVLALVELAKDR